jgi:hypothetical protein
LQLSFVCVCFGFSLMFQSTLKTDDRQTYSNMYFYEENNIDGDGGKDEQRWLGSRGLNQGFQIYPPHTLQEPEQEVF